MSEQYTMQPCPICKALMSISVTYQHKGGKIDICPKCAAGKK